jgi:sugar phosphate isomerase/epimerase
VKILWEPWAGGPNIATGPVGFEALFKAFGDSPWVGLQYDPSHLVWQMMDPIQCARDFANRIYAVHLKDAEIRRAVLRRVGINPPDNTPWWRFRLPGMGAVDWPAFFTVLMEAGFAGPMNIEHEDGFYGWPYAGDEFSTDYKAGFRVAHAYLRQFMPA